MILGHSFVRRLQSDLSRNFDQRASIDFKVDECSVRLFGTGGRTIKKVRQHDMRLIEKFDPDIIILELGTNDLSFLPPEVVGSELDEFIRFLLQRFSMKIVAVCKVINRSDDTFNSKAAILNQYLEVVLGDLPNVLVWTHMGLVQPKHNVLLPDGVHLNPQGQYKLYRSYRGVILQALRKFQSLT